MRDGWLGLLVPGLVGALVVPACSYDWSVAPPGADASTGDGASTGDASVEADAGVPSDGPVDVVTHDATPDSTGLPESGPLPDCTPAQEATVRQARAAALACDAGSLTPCPGTVTDECGCTVLVSEATTGTVVQQYLAAIATLKAECTPDCPGCPTLPTVPNCDAGPSACIARLCLVLDAGAGTYACYQ
jgi:hypothetical protein